MQMSSKSHTAQFMHYIYDLANLFCYVLGLAVVVVLGAYGLEFFFL